MGPGFAVRVTGDVGVARRIEHEAGRETDFATGEVDARVLQGGPLGARAPTAAWSRARRPQSARRVGDVQAGTGSAFAAAAVIRVVAQPGVEHESCEGALAIRAASGRRGSGVATAPRADERGEDGWSLSWRCRGREGALVPSSSERTSEVV